MGTLTPGTTQSAFGCVCLAVGNQEPGGAGSSSHAHVDGRVWTLYTHGSQFRGSPEPASCTDGWWGTGIGRTVVPAVVDIGHNSVDRCTLPEGDQSLPLGDHLLPAMVEKN